MTRLADRIVTSPGAELGVVAVSVKLPDSEATYATTGTVQRIRTPGEVFYLWRTTAGDFGTAEKFTQATIKAATHIERSETRP